jgi:dTDP-4-dehydrorhamnose reductase
MVSQMMFSDLKKRNLILGAKGMLGGALRELDPQATAWDREDVDVTREEEFRSRVTELAPSAILNCVALNDVDGAEDRPGAAFALNADFPGRLAAIAADLRVPLVHYSTNYVFDGVQGEYSEEDEPNPLSVYASSKREGELRVLASAAQAYVLRTAVIFGRKGESEISKRSFIEVMLDLARTRDMLSVVNDEINSITYVRDLAAATHTVLASGLPRGIYHATNSGQASWFDLAVEVFRITGLKVRLQPVASTRFPRNARRPAKAVLRNTKYPALRPWQLAVAAYLADRD